MADPASAGVVADSATELVDSVARAQKCHSRAKRGWKKARAAVPRAHLENLTFHFDPTSCLAVHSPRVAMHRSTCRSLVLAAAAAAAAAAVAATGPRDQFLNEAQLGSLPASALGLPAGLPPRYQMNQSTIIMPCNNSGYTDPQRTVGWSIIDFDCERGGREI